MDTRYSRRLLLTTGCMAGLALTTASLWQTQQKDADTRDLPMVTSTVGMITDVARSIAESAASVSGLMGPGVDPHLYKPSASDIQRLGDADLILYGGLHLEGRMADTLHAIDERTTVRTVAVSETIPTNLRMSSSGQADVWDPHVWMDVSLWHRVAGTIAQELTTLMPADAEKIASRAETYRARLTELDAWAESELERIPDHKRVLVTAHDAFSYFGRRYNVEVIGLQGLSTASEAGASDVQSLANFLTERQIPAIFVESSIPPNTIEAVQAATRSRGWDVRIGGELYADAMGSPGTPDGTYIGMMRHNVRTIVQALLGEHE